MERDSAGTDGRISACESYGEETQPVHDGSAALEDEKDVLSLPPGTGRYEEGARALNEEPNPQMEGGWMYGRVQYIHSFALESWYDVEGLRQHTPATVFVPLSPDQVQAIYGACNKAYSESEKALEAEREILSELELTLDKIVLEQFGGEAFVKLSTRSPKDSITTYPSDRLAEVLSRCLLESDGSENGDTIAFCTAVRQAMACSSGGEMLDMLYESSRVREDIMRVKDCGSYDALPLSLVVREWMPMLPSQEFRVFVKDRRITAISQYCYYQFFAGLPDQVGELTERILEFWAEIAPLWKQESMILDLLVTPSKILIIEVNPYFGDTGACLFSWRGDDRRILLGEAPFEFRILDKPRDDPMGCLPPEWVKWIDYKQGRDPDARMRTAHPLASAPASEGMCSSICMLC